MEPTEKIKAFCEDPEVIIECLALLKVGVDKGDSAQEVMKRILANTLFRYLKIPLIPGGS